LHIPEQIIPILRKVAAASSLGLEFWHADDGNRIMDCFFDLATELTLSELELQPTLPAGYRLVALLFQWESECQSEGWNAFAWTPNIGEVVQAYSDAGLDVEGGAISRAAAAWAINHDDEVTISAAYSEKPNPYSVDQDRLEYLVNFLCERADQLFYAT
jgi:hypothetical protein